MNKWPLIILIIVLVFFGVRETYLRFEDPRLTETQLFLETLWLR